MYNRRMQAIQDALKKVLEPRGVIDGGTTLEFASDLSHGDLSSNAALQYAKELKLSPRALAEALVAEMGSIPGILKIDVAGPGFINFTLESLRLAKVLAEGREQGGGWGKNESLLGKEVMVEYTDPNPFKAFHIGHLMSNAIGESLARLKEFAGAKVIRANYQGDVGVHIACAIWGMQKLAIKPTSADEFGRAYAEGATAYKENQEAKAEIDSINKKIYDRSDTALNALYDMGREESLAAFERIYALLGTKFDRYFFESETGPKGKEIVLANPEVFPESDGARVFKGE